MIVYDGNGGSDTAGTVIKVEPRDDEFLQDNDIPAQTTDEDNLLTLDLSQYLAPHGDGDTARVVSVKPLPSGFSWSQPDSTTLIMTPAENYNTNSSPSIDSLVVKVVDYTNDTLAMNAFNWTISAVNDTLRAFNDTFDSVPYGTTTSLDVALNDDDDADPWGGVDSSTVNLVIPFNNATASVDANGHISFYSETPGWDSAFYAVSDLGYPLPSTSDSAWVFVYVGSQPNQNPTFILPDTMYISEDTTLPFTFISDLSDSAYYSDPEGGSPTFVIYSQSNTELIHLLVDGYALKADSLEADSSGYSQLELIAFDSDGGSDTSGSVVVVEPRADLSLDARWLMDTTLIAGAKLHVDSDEYTMTDGTFKLQLSPGTYEFNVTDTGSIDYTSIWEEYLVIRTPGQDANVEQRAGGDASSPVTIGTADETYTFYKIRKNFNMASVGLAIGTGPSGETIRFAWNPPDPYDYVDTSGTNQPPTQATIDKIQFARDSISAATLGRLNFQYDIGTTPPSDPYEEIAFNSDFGQPSNGTGWNSDFEITDCYAHYPWSDPDMATFLEEIIQAAQNSIDVGISLSNYNTSDSTWHISEFGKQSLRFGYLFDPGSYFITPQSPAARKLERMRKRVQKRK